MRFEDVDGIPWLEFREIANTDPCRPGYWHKSWCDTDNHVNFRHAGCRITLQSDGTWSADAAPDWDGSS